MDAAVYDQITRLLYKSQKILLLAHARPDCDALGSALSMYLILKEMGKDVTVATNDPAPESLLFLPSIDVVQNTLGGTNEFVISVDASKVSLEKIKYNVDGDKVNFILTTKSGSFSPSDISFPSGAESFDLIMVLDTGNLEHLGPLYDKNTELFFNTPVINIDHHASNTDFGQVNLVDVTASSTTEILFEYLKYLENKQSKKLITADIATLLLGGIITDTGSFQHANTSPRAMESSAQLLDLGGRQQEIIKHIYKTKKLSTLKLWGIILSKVQVDPAHRMVWSTISKDDLQEAEADSGETEGIIDDLLTNAPGAEIIFLIKQNTDYVSVSLRSTSNQVDVGQLSADNGGGGHVRAAGFKIRSGHGFEEIVNEIVGKVRQFQANRLNIHPEAVNNLPEVNDGENKKVAEAPQSVIVEDNKPKKTTYLDFESPKSELVPVEKPEEEPKARQSRQPKKKPPIYIEPV